MLQLDANGVAIIIGAIFLGIGKIVSMYIEYKRERDRIVREAATAIKVEAVRAEAVKTANSVAEVKSDLADATEAHKESRAVTDEKLDSMSTQLEVVHKATNSIVTQLVKKSGEEGVLRGEKEERIRADAIRDGIANASVPPSSSTKK